MCVSWCCIRFGFNPYFPGVTFQSNFKSYFGADVWGFNPYFPGVTFQSDNNRLYRSATCGFQSLFSWSYLSKRSSGNPPRSIAQCFNPYFPGVTFQSKCSFYYSIFTDCVSILIFLELPFKVYLWYYHLSCQAQFQSLFSWSYLSKLLNAVFLLNTGSVSILIFLELPFKETWRDIDEDHL